jgi:hypothetical protein
MSLQISFSRLALPNLLSYGKQTIFIVESESITGLDTCAPFIKLKEADGSIESSYKFDRKSKYTDDVKAADEKRNKILKQLFHIVKGFTSSTIEPEVDAAELIDRAITLFGKDLPKQPQNTKSANLNGLLLELSKRNYTPAIELLNLKTVIGLLKTSQMEFETMFYHRGVDKTKGKDAPAASIQRVDYEQAIRDMVSYAEAQVTINADANWKHVCSLIETQNAAYEAQIRNHKDDSDTTDTTK